MTDGSYPDFLIGALGTPDPLGKIARVAIVFIASLIVVVMLYERFAGGHIALLR